MNYHHLNEHGRAVLDAFDQSLERVQAKTQSEWDKYAKSREENLQGGKLSGDHYYRVRVMEPVSNEVAPYTAECADIIEALDMTFNEGEAFKALWRLAAARQGRGKPGNKPQYDADKVAHYGARVAEHTRIRGQRLG